MQHRIKKRELGTPKGSAKLFFLWQGSVLRKNNIPNRRFNNERCNISDTLIVELCAVKWYNITNDHVLPKGKNMMASVWLFNEIWYI